MQECKIRQREEILQTLDVCEEQELHELWWEMKSMRRGLALRLYVGEAKRTVVFPVLVS